MYDWTLRIAFTLLLARSVYGSTCSRYPSNTNSPKSPVDEHFVVAIEGNPQSYILGQRYNVSVNAFNGARFINFKVVLENDNGSIGFNEDLGRFEISDSVETRFSPNCINMVESTNTNPKTRVDLSWEAPTEPGNGCVLIRATILQHRDVWYMDDGGLTKRICEETVDDVESKGVGVGIAGYRPCCACDEARYEITFEGLWSRNHHPRNFPTKGWLTRFSDIVGAAHMDDFSFWQNGEYATDGMKQFAKHGLANILEEEFAQYVKEGKIRTIIKARGPGFPNLNGQSLASVRVDPRNHLVSLASKVMPSPDWFVGISGMELCLRNCTWREERIINLYPWDAGIDAGATYTASNQPQIPADIIHRIRSNFPNDPRMPFYDETGAPMKPLARLTFRRQRLYGRTCSIEQNTLESVALECVTHPWSDWSECTRECGQGKQFRRRLYKQPTVALNFRCTMELEQERLCVGQQCSTSQDYEARATQQKLDELTPEQRDSTIRRIPPDELYEVKEWPSKTSRGPDLQRYTVEPAEQLNDDNMPSQWNTAPDVQSYAPYENAKFPASEEFQQSTGRNDDLDEQSQSKFEVGNLNKETDHVLQPARWTSQPFGSSTETENFQNSYNSSPSNRIPQNCFKKLDIKPCRKAGSKRNYWFYNYCEGICMLYTGDACDRNKNRFNSLEVCERHCRQPLYTGYLRKRQQLDCQLQ